MKQLVLAIGPLVIGFQGIGVLPVLAIDHGASHVIVAVFAWLVMFFIGSGLALLLFIPMRRWLPRASLVSWVCGLLLIAVGLYRYSTEIDAYWAAPIINLGLGFVFAPLFSSALEK